YSGMGRFQEALKEIYNLQIFFEVLDVPEIKVSTMVLNAYILTNMKKFEQAIEILWQAYEQIKVQKTMLMHIYLLYNMGRTYLQAGDKELARLYLTLASKAV